jgi:hypothetical protein
LQLESEFNNFLTVSPHSPRASLAWGCSLWTDGSAFPFAQGCTPTSIAGVSPAKGPLAGGTVVAISGSGLGPGTQVYFGGVPAAPAPGPCAADLCVISPAGSTLGAVDVTTLGSYQSAADLFTYAPIAGGVRSISAPDPAPTGTVVLDGLAPAGGAFVALSSSDPTNYVIPSTVWVPDNTDTATFVPTFIARNVTETVTLPARYNGVAATTTTTLTALPPLSLGIDPDGLLYQQNAVGTVTLNAPAPQGGALILLSSSSPSKLQTGSSITISAGSTVGTFNATDLYSGLLRNVVVTVTATEASNNASASATVTLNPRNL